MTFTFNSFYDFFFHNFSFLSHNYDFYVNNDFFMSLCGISGHPYKCFLVYYYDF